MFKNYDKRGSVLLVVVGLLVILGTLGGTFLLVSSLDARQSKLLAGRGKAELVASGGVGKVVRMLGQDLHFSAVRASPPFSAPNTNLDADDGTMYTFYIDYPSDIVDKHLYRAGHPSNVFGFDAARLSGFTLVSTEFKPGDAGAQNDSYLIPTGEFSDDGEQYYIAIKVVDMSGLLSLNTGGWDYLSGVADTSEMLKSPALIRLKEWMGDALYNAIHLDRCGGAIDIQQYDRECGRKLLSPEPIRQYMPFAIADEAYLRWLGPSKKTNFARLFTHLDAGMTVANRQLLTTMNSSRSILRSPVTGVITSRIDLSEANALDSDGKNGLYAQIVMIAGSKDGLGGIASPGEKRLTDDSFAEGFYLGGDQWEPVSPPNAYNNNSKRCRNTPDAANAWWIFKGLPQASYRVWASWGPAANAGSSIPYKVYHGGDVSITYTMDGAISTYGGGTQLGAYVVNQTQLPSDSNFDGRQWQSLGSHWAEGQLVVELNKPLNVPAGQTRYSFADAIRIEGINVALGSGSQPAAHLTANTWVAMSKHDPAKPKPRKAFAFRPPGKDYTVFGVQEQPFITEAFATHTTRSQDSAGKWVEDSWKWGAAIELMNFSSKAISLADYGLVFDSALANDTTVVRFPNGWSIPAATDAGGGGRLVLYDFRAGSATVTAATVFGRTELNPAVWKQVDGLNFDKKTIRLVRVATDNDQTYNIPIDRVVAGDAANGNLTYEQLTDAVKTSAEPNKTEASNCKRDDSLTRHRYSVAIYQKAGPTATTGHTLGAANNAAIADTTLKDGFRIKLRHGLLSGPGDLSDLYLVGPILYDKADSPPADLPELLAREFAMEESRGRANSYAKDDSEADFNAAPWNAYPRKRGATKLAWPLLLGEIIETVPMDLQRGDSPPVYGRINVNTASQKVLEQLPWPTGVNAATAAGQIITYRDAKGGFVTPGEVALALNVPEAERTLDKNRDAIYAAISGCITVNSDMYAVTVRVQLGNSQTPAADRSWFYVAVVDRGGAVASTDKPAVVLFTQVE